jgi:hypothetical protein
MIEYLQCLFCETAMDHLPRTTVFDKHCHRGYMSAETRRRDNDTVKYKNSEKNLSQCHFVHHNFHMDWSGRETALRLERDWWLTAWAIARPCVRATTSSQKIPLITSDAYQPRQVEGHKVFSEPPLGERNRDESGSDVGQRVSLVGSTWRKTNSIIWTSYRCASLYVVFAESNHSSNRRKNFVNPFISVRSSEEIIR